MGSLRISKVAYSGDKYWFESPEFPTGLSIIEGPNGSGKSTFFNLIYYCLGGKVDEFEMDSRHAHKQIAGDTNNFVHMRIAINGAQHSLTRQIGDSSIAVHSEHVGDEPTDARKAFVLPIYRRNADQRTFSDWLLEELGIAVVEIYQGGRNFKLNFTDLARLIYHNQSPDPHGVFKPADSINNFVSDSLEVRRAIFQVLVGKTLLALYQAIGRLKRAEKDKESAKAILAEYTNIVSELLSANGIREVTNRTHLLSRISEMSEQLEKLNRSRSSRSVSDIDAGEVLATFELSRRRYEEISSQRSALDERLTGLFREKARLDEVQSVLHEDIRRIEKILYTHEQLKLFSADTCPYCLNTVQRAKDRCVCGCIVDEKNYQRFFYSSSEYIDILKSKAKSLETLQSGATSVLNEIEILAKNRDNLTIAAEEARIRLTQTADQASRPQDQYLDALDEKIFELRNVIGELEQALKLEDKLASFQNRYDSASLLAQNAKSEADQLYAASRLELTSRIESFNRFYTEMMTSVLTECRTARIDPETYLPVINNGEYREASADVSKRFLYYLTLLRISLNEDIPFPRLLLVDTPETAGIDLQNLVKMLREVGRATKASDDYQILLSTGIEKYPKEYSDRVAIRLKDDYKLLREREQAPLAAIEQ